MSLTDEIEPFLGNPERRCPVVLLLDTSASMSGERIAQLQTGINTFKREVQADTTAALRVEVALITFNTSAELVQEFVDIKKFAPPVLSASGQTALGQGIDLALSTVQERSNVYREYGISYYKPWIFLITDGIPTDEWTDAAARVRDLRRSRKLTFFAVGVEGANMNILKQIAPSKRLDGLKFQELFQWISDSLTKVSHSREDEQVELPPTNDWDTDGWEYV